MKVNTRPKSDRRSLLLCAAQEYSRVLYQWNSGVLQKSWLKELFLYCSWLFSPARISQFSSVLVVRTFSSHFYTRSHLSCYCQKKEMHSMYNCIPRQLQGCSGSNSFNTAWTFSTELLLAYSYIQLAFYTMIKEHQQWLWELSHKLFSLYYMLYQVYLLPNKLTWQVGIKILPFFHLQVQIEGQVWEAVVTTSAPTTSIRSRLKRPIFEAMTSSNQFKSTWE